MSRWCLIAVVGWACAAATHSTDAADARTLDAGDAPTRQLAIAAVAEATALGFGNNHSLFVQSDGTAIVALHARDHGAHFNNEVLRSSGAWNSGQPYRQVFLAAADGIQQSAAIAVAPDGSAHLVWAAAQSADVAHQLGYARVGAAMAIQEQVTPLKITGFASVYAAPYPTDEAWQEHPSALLALDGTLHVVWEGRDARRVDDKGVPVSAIAYVARDSAGRWNARGEIATPPYVSPPDSTTRQMRPSLVATPKGVEILCTSIAVRGVAHVQVGSLTTPFTDIPGAHGDQRHIAGAVDSAGRLHVVWREGSPAGPSVVRYALRDADVWSTPVTLSTAGQFASTPTIAVDETTVHVAWVEWPSGTNNSLGQMNNGYPDDDGAVEGGLFVASAPIGSTSFTDGTLFAKAPAAGPVFARGRVGMLAWLSGTNALCPQDGSCVSVLLGVVP